MSITLRPFLPVLALALGSVACGGPLDDEAGAASPLTVYADDADAPEDQPPGDDVDADADTGPIVDDADDDEDDAGDVGDVDDLDDGGDDVQVMAALRGCPAYTTRHLQASMQHTDSVAQLRQAIDRAFVNPDGVSPDTIAWTEIETQAQIDRINNRPGWATYWPSHPNHPGVNPRNAVPISWKKSVYQFVSGSTHKASDGLARVSPDRYVTRVRLRHIASGTVVVRVATHTVSAVDHPKPPVAYRLATHKKDIAMFDKIMEGAAAPAIGSGDFNTVHLRAKLRQHNHGRQPYVFDVPAHGGSHGHALLDWIVRKKSDGGVYSLKDVRFVDLSPSDHKGVRARYRYQPACR